MSTTVQNPMTITEEMKENSSQAAKFLKTLSNEQRLLILCILHDNELSVSELNELMPQLSQSALSQHLSILRNENLVATRKKSQTIYYKLSSHEAARLIHLMHEMFCAEACQ